MSIKFFNEIKRLANVKSRKLLLFMLTVANYCFPYQFQSVHYLTISTHCHALLKYRSEDNINYIGGSSMQHSEQILLPLPLHSLHSSGARQQLNLVRLNSISFNKYYYCNFLLLTHLKQASNQLQRNHRSHYVLGASKSNYRAVAKEAIFVVVRMQQLDFSLEAFTKLKALAKMSVCQLVN